MRLLWIFVVLALGGCAQSAHLPIATSTINSASSSAAPSSSAASSPTPTPTLKPTPTPTPKPTLRPTGLLIKTASSQYGEVLFDGQDRVFYLFAKEQTKTPECYDACADAWPPVLTSGAPRPSGKVSPDLVGTTTRRDGRIQVTYAGHPMYYYVGDGPREVTCNNVSEFGGLWLVLDRAGQAVAGQ